jgi:hypothetical protein
MRYLLKPHPAFPPSSVQSVEVEISATDQCEMLLDFRVKGDKIVIPTWQAPCRADELWKCTCFELFIGGLGSESYFEFNFSPSGRWAAYRFDSYRRGMRDLNMTIDPQVELDPARPLQLTVDLDLSEMPGEPLFANITAVIEEEGGRKSYWALAHADGPPDFHNRDCFVASLPPVEEA